MSGIDFGVVVCEDECMEQNNPLVPGGDGVTGGNVAEQIGNFVEGSGYKPNYVVEPGYTEKVLADSGKAQELADIEDAARKTSNNTTVGEILSKEFNARESQWHKEDEMAGLTPVEKANMDILEGLTMKNSEAINQHAFIDIVDAKEKGRKYRMLRPTARSESGPFPGEFVFFCKDGAYVIGYSIVGGKSEVQDVIDWKSLGDGIDQLNKKSIEIPRQDFSLPFGEGRSPRNTTVDIRKFDLKDVNVTTILAEAIRVSETRGLKKIEDERKRVIDSQEVLSRLV